MITEIVAWPRERLEQLSTRIVFFIAGFVMAAWAPLVPFAKARAAIDDGVLGLILLCLGVGSIVTMPLAGALAARFGCRLVIAASTVLLCLTLPLLATVASLPLLVAAVLVFGAGIGALDVAINIQAIIVERASGRPMMSGFHGQFSLGGIAGAAGVTALLGAGSSPLAATLCVSRRHPRPAGAGRAASPALRRETRGPAFAVPHGVVLFIGALCFIVFLTEGAVLDWSAVFLTRRAAWTRPMPGLGYAAFALTMTVGRLTGDRIVQRFGRQQRHRLRRPLRRAGLHARGAGSVLAIALLGYALVGVGCSNVVPVLFTSVGRQTVMPEHVAVPAITTLGYAGILAGPAVIGLVAHAASLPTAFLMLAIMLLGVAAGGRLLRV